MQKPRTRKSKPRPAAPAEADALRTRLATLTERANAGDTVALAELRAFLDDHPEVWQQVGDLNRLSIRYWSSLLSGGNALQRESIGRYIEQWKAELAGPAATRAEQALIDTAAVAKLAVAHAECAAASSSESLDAAVFKVKRLDSGVRRLNSTLKLLIQVRSAHPAGLVPTAPSPAGPRAGRPRLRLVS